MKRICLGLALGAALLSGCAASKDGPSFGNIGRNFSDDWTGARGYDRASTALERGNLDRVREVGREIERHIEGGGEGSLSIAQTWINDKSAQAASLEDEAANEGDPVLRAQSRRESERLYRGALAFLPTNPKYWRDLSSQTLNSVGYFLAQSGRNQAEFAQAAQLTKLALDSSPATDSQERYARALGPQDSYAWALFKQGKVADALATETQVLTTASEEQSKYGPPVAEVVYHMGVILRVAGHEEQARAAFKTALSLGPSEELKEILNLAVDGRVV